MQNIRHRNLVKILTCLEYDYEEMEFKAWVNEYMENGTLESWLNYSRHAKRSGHSRILSLRSQLDVAIDVAQALNYLHNRSYTPIVHFDLKPTNILLDTDMVAHVSDFGLANILLPTDNNSSQLSIGVPHHTMNVTKNTTTWKAAKTWSYSKW